MPRVKVGGFNNSRFVGDKRGYDIPQDHWTEVRNVRFNPFGAEAFAGHAAVFGTPPITPLWVKAFPPVEAPLWVYGNLTKMYVYDGTSHTEITRLSGDYAGLVTERWQGEVLNGIGFFNNTIDVPQMWTAFDTSVDLADLTNWPSTVRCKFLRPFKYYLFAGYAIESGNDRPYRLRWSHPAAPGTIPSSWALNDPTKDSGEIDIAETEDYLVDGLTLGEVFIVYKQKNVHLVQYVGRPNVFGQWRIVPGRGLLARDCVHAFPGGHFVAGLDDIYYHTGERGSERSLVEGDLRRWVYKQIDSTNFFNCYVVNYQLEGESWFCFPEAGETYPTLALVWNRNTNGVGIRDMFQSPFTYTGPVLAAVAGPDGTWGGAPPAPPPAVLISNQLVDDGLNLGATYRCQSNGVAEVFTEDSGSFDAIPGEWLVSGLVSEYQIRATLLSGDTPSVVGPALGVWGSFGGQYSISANKHCELLIEIRRLSTLEVLDTATIILDTLP